MNHLKFIQLFTIQNPDVSGFQIPTVLLYFFRKLSKRMAFTKCHDQMQLISGLVPQRKEQVFT